MSAKKKPKITETRKIRKELFDDSCINSVRKLWKVSEKKGEGKYLPVNLAEFGVDVIQTPFPVCLVRNLAPCETLRAVIEEIPSVNFYEKSNDLYQFHQTSDVANFKDLKAITNLYSLICSDVFEWVEKTLVPSGLRPGIAATLSCYALGDRLLCHDDKCEDRHIAFVLYLTEGWAAEDGGNLELLETDEKGDPLRPVVSIPALYNTLVLFEVSSTSYHQVTEVTSTTKKRLSINGWFHKANLPEWSEGPPRDLLTFPPSSSEFQLNESIFVKYLSFRNQLDIKSMFIRNSEIQLDEFLLPEVFQEIKQDFTSSDINWQMVGPSNIRHYEVAEAGALPRGLSSIWSLLQSVTWLRFLKYITGLDLVPLSKSDITAWQKGIEPSCRVELQRWLPGSYSLVHDRDPEFHTAALDVFIRVPMQEEVPDSEDDTPEPGHIIYIDKQSQDEECLLHLGYKMNSLGLIFREPGTLRFTKYLDSSATPFYQIQCLYIPWAPPEDEPDLKHVDSEEETEPESADEASDLEEEEVKMEELEEEEEEVEPEVEGADAKSELDDSDEDHDEES